MFAIDLIARDIMSSPVITVKSDMSVEEVSDLFTDRMITGAPVVDENDRPVGVVTLTDIVRNEPRREHIVSDRIASDYVLRDWHKNFNTDDLSSGYHLEESETLMARDIMTPFVYRVEEDTPVRELAEILVSGRIHRLFVTRNEKITGVVSALDILKTMIRNR